MSVAQPRARATHRIRVGACTGAMVDPFVLAAGQGPSAQSAWQVVFILLTHEAGGGCGAGLPPVLAEREKGDTGLGIVLCTRRHRRRTWEACYPANLKGRGRSHGPCICGFCI